MSDLLKTYPELEAFLDKSEDYETTASEFQADGRRWLLVTQSGAIDGGQFLFEITGRQLELAKAGTVIDLNPSRPESGDLDEEIPSKEPGSPAEHVAVARVMRDQVNIFSTAAGPGGGNLACVWAARRIVKAALGQWITRTDSTAQFAKELSAQFGRTFDETEVSEGGIVISPTGWSAPGRTAAGHGHVGLLGPREPGKDRLIYSNSSSLALWKQNFTLPSWKARYMDRKGLQVLFFPVPQVETAVAVAAPPVGAPAERESASANLERAGDLASLAEDFPPSDPLAGEGPPRRRAIVLDEHAESNGGDLPISEAQALKVARWMKANFGPALDAAVVDTPFRVDLLCAMVCQETAYFWVSFIDSLPPSTIVERCVLDATGDYPGTEGDRSAFPVNAAKFRAKYGDAFTAMLIEEANKTRALRNYSPKSWLYKGYGIFQYDLQFVQPDEAFFREKQWYSFDTCLAKAMGELKETYARTGDLWKAVRAYNGSGPRATVYANNVMQFAAWCAEPPPAPQPAPVPPPTA